jgi:hypothetical protein
MLWLECDMVPLDQRLNEQGRDLLSVQDGSDNLNAAKRLETLGQKSSNFFDEVPQVMRLNDGVIDNLLGHSPKVLRQFKCGVDGICGLARLRGTQAAGPVKNSARASACCRLYELP